MKRQKLARVALGLPLLFLFVGCSSDPDVDAVDPVDVGADTGETLPDAVDVEVDAGADVTGPEGLEITEGCNPLAFEHDCMLPYPSNGFLVEDAAMPSGWRVELAENARATMKSGAGVSFLDDFPEDGFSTNMPIMALFPQGVSTANVVFHTDDPAPTLEPTSTTILLRADTGEPVAHWAELDKTSPHAAQQTFIIRLYDRLEYDTRYIVAIQNLRDQDGELIEAPNGFRQLRDGERDAHPALDAALDRFDEEVFPALAEFGVERAGLQLAWDFTTRSRTNAIGDMLVIRDDLLARFEVEPPAVTITDVEEEFENEIFRRITGTITVPLYLESTELMARLNRDAEGVVTANGTTEVPFTMLVPKSVGQAEAEDRPARLIQYGHGFFGLRAEIEYGYMRGFIEETGTVSMSMDWWGMSEHDAGEVGARMSSKPAETMRFVDRVYQAMANKMAMTVAAKTTLLETEAVRIDGEVLYNPDELYYYGISQGHIFGGTFVALSPHIDRAVFGVGGASYSLMMSRSSTFTALLQVLSIVAKDRIAVQKFIALTQGPFDGVDPISYGRHLVDELLPGSPASRRVLMQVGIADTSVPNMASHLHARSAGISLMNPAPRAIPMIDTIDGPVDGSAMIEVDFNIDPLPDIEAKLPRDTNGVHEGLRRLAPITAQIDAFLRPDGLIENFCDGACSPE